MVDTTFLVDYLDDHDAVRAYLQYNPDVYVTPAPAYTEVLQGEIHPPGLKMGAVDALVGALARRAGATVVSNDRDLTHDETSAVVDVDEYRG